MDVAHCRINLLYQGVDAAEVFVTRGWQTDTGCSFHRWAEIATIIGFLDAERRQPSPQRKRHDLASWTPRYRSTETSPSPTASPHPSPQPSIPQSPLPYPSHPATPHRIPINVFIQSAQCTPTQCSTVATPPQPRRRPASAIIDRLSAQSVRIRIANRTCEGRSQRQVADGGQRQAAFANRSVPGTIDP